MTTINTGGEMLQLAGVQQFHEQGHGAADLALALLISSDGAQVVDAQNGGKAGLREPGPLADCFEFDGVHLRSSAEYAVFVFPVDVGDEELAIAVLADSEIVAADRLGQKNEAIICTLGSRIQGRHLTGCLHDGEGEIGGLHGSSLPLDERHEASVECEAGGIFERGFEGVEAAAGDDVVDAGVDLGGYELDGHLHSPVSGGALPRGDEQAIGPMARTHKHNRTRFVAFFNTGGEG